MNDNDLFSSIKDVPEDAAFTDEQLAAIKKNSSEAHWEWLTGLPPSERSWHTGQALYTVRSWEQARRLGMEPSSEYHFLHNPIALVELVTGVENGAALAETYNFVDGVIESGYYFRRNERVMPMPETMWHVIAQRRDGDAIIAFIGDDRGYEQHWTYYIAVAWSPKALADAHGYTPALI